MTHTDTPETRQTIIDGCLQLNASGLNQGTSGNISVRVGDAMLITPSGIPYDEMTPDMICRVPISGTPDPDGPYPPSSEWQFHQAALQANPEMHAVVHAHPTYCTALAIQRTAIPACHYMVALFGGSDVPVVNYATFGSAALAQGVTRALRDRTGCLLANHGAIATGETLRRALWRMEELETLARVYTLAKASGTPVLLSDAEIAEVVGKLAHYGPL